MFDNNYHQPEVERSAGKVFKDGKYQGISGYQRFTIVTMCGSTKFKEEYLSTIERLTYLGCLVLFCPIFHHADGIEIPEHEVRMLTDIHKQRIKMCDDIFIINKDGYIGDSTKMEIEYAKGLGKNIHYLEPIEEGE